MYIGSIQKNQTPVSVWFLLTYTGAVILTFFSNIFLKYLGFDSSSTPTKSPIV